MSRAGDRNFALVVFSQVPEFYVTDQNVECHFTVTAGVEISKWDWIGLYRVGWSKQNQQICYEWVPVAPTDPNGERNLSIQFPSQSLPKEEGEFYQFVYISSMRGTIGCSTPFQFRKPRATDFVEEEFEDMMVVRSKSSVMQEKIEYLENELVLFNQGRAKLESRVMALEAEIKARDTMISNLQAELGESQRNEKMTKEAHAQVSQELEEKMKLLEEMYKVKEQLEQYQLAAAKSLDEVNSKKMEMEASIKALQSEKDALSGQNQSLVDELASYKDQVTESQSAAASKVKEVAHLTNMLQQMVETSATCEATIKELEAAGRQKDKDLMQKSEQLAMTQVKLKVVEEECDTLKNEVQNSQDMLDACQSMKDKMLQDLKAYEQTQTKMSKRVETQESDTRQLKEAMKKKSEECDNLSQVVQGLEKEVREKDQHLTRAQLQASRAQEELATSKSQLQESTQKVVEMEARMAEMVENCAIQIQTVYNQLDETRRAQEQLKLKTAEDAKELERLGAKNAELMLSQQQAEEKTQTVLHLKQASDEAETELKRKLHEQEKEIEGWVSEMTRKEDTITKYRDEITRLISEVEGMGTSLEEKTRAEEIMKQELSSKDEIINTIQRDLERCEKEMAKLRGKLAQYKEKEEAASAAKNETNDENTVLTDPQGSWFALKMASDELRIRLEDRTKELSTLKLERKEWEIERDDSRKEIRDLRDRLQMAKVEYTKLMTENNRLLRKLQKHKELKRSASLNTSSSPQVSLEEPPSSSEESSSHKRHSHKEPSKHTKYYLLTTDAQADKMWTLKEQNSNLEKKNNELSKENQEKDKQISKLQEKLMQMPLQTDEHDSQEAAFHDSLASVPDSSLSEIEAASARQEEETNEMEAAGGVEEGAAKEVQKVELLYANPYSLYKPVGDSEQKKPETKVPIFVPTTEEDVAPAFIVDPMCAASMEEDGDLPRPLDPEVMPEAKLAAVKQQIGCTANASDIDDHLLFEDCSPELPLIEESFMDAIGESMNICPQCQATVMTSGAFHEHMAAHFGRICPMCKSQADDSMTENDFEKHVNKCCELAEEADNA